MATRIGARPKPDTGEAPPTHLKAMDKRRFGYAHARHLLWRAGFGGTPSQIQTLASWGVDKAVDHLLDFEQVPYETPSPDRFDPDIMRPLSEEDRQRLRNAQRSQDENTLAQYRLRRQQAQRRDRQQIVEMQRWWLKRMIETPRPFEEKMTLFWHGRLPTGYRTIENSYHMYLQNQMFRAHGAGNFGAILTAIVHDPAMLKYLDNDESSKRRPNENLARELMELFSLGVGAYTERDIKEGARALTGYTFRDDEFYFDRRNHDTGTKLILGVRGAHDGESFVRAILAQKACSHYLASNLYRFFVRHIPTDPRQQDEDTQKIVSRIASSLRRWDYEIRPVLRELFTSEHFYHPRIVGEQIKSPVELVVGAVRSLNTPARDLGVLNDALDLMGQRLFFPPSVKGWDGGRAWINTSTMFVRQNILAFLLTGKKPVGYDAMAEHESFDPMPLLSTLEAGDPGSTNDARKVVDYLLRLTLGDTPASAREVLTEFIESHGGVRKDVVTGALLLITAMPEYQLC
ncbi:MAG: DUF1800 family protein [Phycisphaerales bacterium JB059]